MNNQQKQAKKASPLGAGIILFLIGLMSEVYALIPIGIVMIVIHIVKKKAQKSSEKKEQPPAQPVRRQPAEPVRQKKSVIDYDAETRTAGKRREEDHKISHAQYDKFGGAPHIAYGDIHRQARAEIRNLKNIRYARSELTGRTLSDTVIWHSRKGVCSSVVQIIRQGNLRYPDLSDKELSERILSDDDLMQDLARSLEWEKRTEIRWN